MHSLIRANVVNTKAITQVWSWVHPWDIWPCFFRLMNIICSVMTCGGWTLNMAPRGWRWWQQMVAQHLQRGCLHGHSESISTSYFYILIQSWNTRSWQLDNNGLLQEYYTMFAQILQCAIQTIHNEVHLLRFSSGQSGQSNDPSVRRQYNLLSDDEMDICSETLHVITQCQWNLENIDGALTQAL